MFWCTAITTKYFVFITYLSFFSQKHAVWNSTTQRGELESYSGSVEEMNAHVQKVNRKMSNWPNQSIVKCVFYLEQTSKINTNIVPIRGWALTNRLVLLVSTVILKKSIKKTNSSNSCRDVLIKAKNVNLLVVLEEVTCDLSSGHHGYLYQV